MVHNNFNKAYIIKINKLLDVLSKSQLFDENFYPAEKSGIGIDVFRNVFSPTYFDDSEFFADNLPSSKELRVLEIGTGTGLIASKFALSGAQSVVATDINPDAIKNTIHNLTKNNIQNLVELRLGYIFKPIKKGEKFDLIFWNIPFCYIDTDIKQKIGLKKLNDLEKSILNPFYNYLFDYLNEGFDYLNSNGKLILGFSPTIGREDILDDITLNLGLSKTVLKETEVRFGKNKEILQIIEFTKDDTN